MLAPAPTSWFWVPIIGHALGLAGVDALPSDTVMYQQWGAGFSLSTLVRLVADLLQSGAFQLTIGDLQPRRAGDNQLYVSAVAQEQLMDLLRRQATGALANDMFQMVTSWFAFRYKLDVLRFRHLRPGQTLAQPARAQYH